MTNDLSQALANCREKVEGLYKDIESLKADNARLQADCFRRIPREHYEQMQAQIDELSRKCVRLSDERDRLKKALEIIKANAALVPNDGPNFVTTLGIAAIAAHALESDRDPD